MFEHKYVFIGGIHRSGTSILLKLLRGHPEISGFIDTNAFEDEGQHLQSVYPTWELDQSEEISKPKELIRRFINRMLLRKRLLFAFNNKAHLTETSSYVSAENQTKLFSEWKIYWDLNKQFLLEKSPPNIIRTRFLQAMFPNSYFIIVRRHPIAVSLAIQKWVKWSERTTFPLFEHWIKCHDIFKSDQLYLRNSFEFKHEDFISKPDVCLKEIHSFLGIDYHPAEEDILSNTNEKYYRIWRRWHENPNQITLVNKIQNQFEDKINSFGYSFFDLEK